MDPVTRARYQQAMDELESGGERAPRWKPHAGMNTIRIIPKFDPKKTNEVDFFKKYKAVFGLGVEGNRMITPRDQFSDAHCPFQAWYSELCQKTDEISRRAAIAAKPKQQIAIWVIDREKEGEGPKLWYTTPKNLRTILSICCDDDWGDITLAMPDADNKGARDLKINYTPQDQSPTNFAQFDIGCKPQPTPLGTQAQMQQWLSEDLFAKHRIGHASDVGWIEAVLNGTEKEYIEMKQQSPTGEVSAPAPETSHAAPEANPAPAPSAPAVPSVSLPAGINDGDQWWVVDSSGKTVPTTPAEIAGMVGNGDDPMCMPHSQEGGWKIATERGFVKIAPPPAPAPPAAPPAPAPPAAPPVPAPPGGEEIPFEPGPGTMSTLEEELKRLQAMQEQQSSAAASIEQGLKA